MARRMFSTRIVSSARFLKMPISSQALYFHLGVNADDDGVVEAYNVMMSVGCSEDDLKVLVAKGFVQVLNEDMVSFIIDWRENNKLRSDRKIDSIYKNLLLSVNPDVELLEKTERSDKKKAVSDDWTVNGQSMDGQGTSNGRPMDGQWTVNGQSMDGVGKDSIGKDSIEEIKRREDADLALAHLPIPKKEPFELPNKTQDATPFQKQKYGEYQHVLLSQNDFQKLVSEHGMDMVVDCIKFFDEYIEQKGYKNNNHYLAINKWVVSAVNERRKKTKGSLGFENERKTDYMKLFGQGD